MDPIDRLTAATERIADVFERIEKQDEDSRRFADVLCIWDGWHNSREEGQMRPPEVVLDEIGEVLYRTRNQS